MNLVNETVYNLLNQLPDCSSSQSTHSRDVYRSIFASNVVESLKKNKHAHRTMGPVMISKLDPHHPLRRRQNFVELPAIVPFTRMHRMPPIPKVTELDRTELKPVKNYIKGNKNQIVKSLPICPRRYIVSDRKGNKYLIDGSGLQKDFIHKKTYGKVPSYLKTRKTVDKQFRRDPDENSMSMISAEERFCLISNLRERYQETFAEYQRLPLRVETASAITKQIYLTDELVSLERDIKFLEKYPHIFIVH